MLGKSESKVRSSAIAGTWYPGTEQALRRMLKDFLANVPERQLDGEVVGLVAPHAGYIYSGQVAAHAYKLVQGQSYNQIVVLSPCHRPYSGRFLTTAARYYSTPLGQVEVDTHILDRLSKHIPITRLAQDDEHSLEIQLPFLQYTLESFQLIPIMLRDQTWEDCQALAEALDQELGADRPFVVASSDLCHAHNYEHVKNTDAATLAALEGADPRTFWQTSWRLQGACGFGAVTTAMLITQRWGAKQIVVLERTNSGDVTAQRSGYVVGYAAAAMLRPL